MPDRPHLCSTLALSKTHGAHKEQAQVGQASAQRSSFWATSRLLTPPRPLQAGRDPARFPAVRHDAEHGTEEG